MYGKSLEIHPMKIAKLADNKKYMREEICSNGEFFAQIKKDGFMEVFELDSEGNAFLFSRVVSTQTGHLSEKGANVPHIIECLKNLLPNGTILIGEMYYPGKTSKDVSSIMGCDSDKAVERQNGEYGFIHYYIHDILYYNGESFLDKTNLERYEFFQNLFQFGELKDTPEYIEFAQSYFSDECDINKMIDDLIEAGEEGMVLKKKDGKYLPGKRATGTMIKFKCEDEADCICMGYEEPTREYTGDNLDNWQYWENVESGNKLTRNQIAEWAIGKYPYEPVTKPYYKGWIGAIKFGAYNKDGELVQIGTVSSGLTDEDYEDIKNNPDNWLMNPISVKYMQTYDGKLRHPIFQRVRIDLNINDCTWDKIFK